MRKEFFFVGSFIEKYANASGAGAKTKKELRKLVSEIEVSAETTEAAIQVIESLKKRGFTYNHNAFTAQQVLESKSVNCLGLPLLVGTILG